LDNLSEYQIEALSNLLRVEVTNNDGFISLPTGSEKSAVYQFIFPFALYEAFQLLVSNDVYVEPKTQEIVIYNILMKSSLYCEMVKDNILEEIIQLLYANYMSILI
jgi:hypothetical protein